MYALSSEIFTSVTIPLCPVITETHLCSFMFQTRTVLSHEPVTNSVQSFDVFTDEIISLCSLYECIEVGFAIEHAISLPSQTPDKRKDPFGEIAQASEKSGQLYSIPSLLLDSRSHKLTVLLFHVLSNSLVNLKSKSIAEIGLEKPSIILSHLPDRISQKRMDWSFEAVKQCFPSLQINTHDISFVWPFRTVIGERVELSQTIAVLSSLPVK